MAETILNFQRNYEQLSMTRRTTLANAKIDLARYTELLKDNYTPERQVANQQTTVSQDEAASHSAEAAISKSTSGICRLATRSGIASKCLPVRVALF
jgi:multidrug resistance efflux pump